MTPGEWVAGKKLLINFEDRLTCRWERNASQSSQALTAPVLLFLDCELSPQPYLPWTESIKCRASFLPSDFPPQYS